MRRGPILKSADTRFHSCILTTEDELKRAYRLRYRIFVEQYKFEPANDARLETDAYDQRAVHVGLWSRRSTRVSLPLAYLRLVIPNRRSPANLPGQQAYAATPEVAVKFNRLAQEGAVELSRICKQPQTPSAAMLYLQACAIVLGVKMGFENSIAVMDACLCTPVAVRWRAP